MKSVLTIVSGTQIMPFLNFSRWLLMPSSWKQITLSQLIIFFLVSIGCSKKEPFSSVEQPTGQIESQELLMSTGQWRDPKTGLIWMRCSIGETWNGRSCTGEPLELNWQESQDYVAKVINSQEGFASHKNWRIPNIKELASIRDCRGYAVMTENVLGLTLKKGFSEVKIETVVMKKLPNGEEIPLKCALSSAERSRPTWWDKAIFPVGSREKDWNKRYWSVTPHESIELYAWFVNFSDSGRADYRGRSFYSYARAVRDSH